MRGAARAKEGTCEGDEVDMVHVYTSGAEHEWDIVHQREHELSCGVHPLEE